MPVCWLQCDAQRTRFVTLLRRDDMSAVKLLGRKRSRLKIAGSKTGAKKSKPVTHPPEAPTVEERPLALIGDEPIYLHLEGRTSVSLQRRFASLFRSVWGRIPANDQFLIRVKARRYKDGLRVLLSRGTCERTNGWVNVDRGQIWIDAWFVEAATDRLVKAIIAHELGHVRGYGDPCWPDVSEAVAKLYAERLWRFAGGDPVFKSKICLRLDEVIREVGLKAQAFQYRIVCNGEPEDTYLMLPRGRKLDFDPDWKLDRIGGGEDDFETLAASIRTGWQHSPRFQPEP